MPRRRTAALDRVLAYENDEVVARFCKTWGTPRTEARRIFGDLMRYLWLAGNRHDLSPVPIVDEMWHAFIVYTRDYERFCKRYFGRMIHHGPTTVAELRALDREFARSPARARTRIAKQLKREVGLVLDQLGEQVVLRWYVAYAERYNTRFFKRAFQPPEIASGRFSPELKARAQLA